MSLEIYETIGGTPISSDGDFTNALLFNFDGRTGGIVEKKLYLRNTNGSFSYSSISIASQQAPSSIDLINETGSSQFSFKMNAGDTRPTSDQWLTVTSNNSISMSNISDTSTYLPFWVRYEVPSQLSVKSYTQVSLSITAVKTV